MAFTATAPINKLFDFNRNAALIINAMNGNSNDVIRLSAHRPDLGVYANAFRDMLLNVSGQTVAAKSGTPGTTGAWFAQAAQTFTDSDTAESGTAAVFSATSFGRPTVAASNATVTVTDGATVYIANSPADGTNVTISSPWALWVDAGNTRLDGTTLSLGGISYTVPTDDGEAGEQLQTNGSGVLTWESAASLREFKNILGEIKPLDALKTLIGTKVYKFQYKEDARRSTGDKETEYVGVVGEEAPWAMHHKGEVFNPINAFGYSLLGIQALYERLTALEQKLA